MQMDTLTICGPIGKNSRKFSNETARSTSPMSILFHSQAIGADEPSKTPVVKNTVFDSLLKEALSFEPKTDHTRRVKKKSHKRRGTRRK